MIKPLPLTLALLALTPAQAQYLNFTSQLHQQLYAPNRRKQPPSKFGS